MICKKAKNEMKKKKQIEKEIKRKHEDDLEEIYYLENLICPRCGSTSIKEKVSFFKYEDKYKCNNCFYEVKIVGNTYPTKKLLEEVKKGVENERI